MSRTYRKQRFNFLNQTNNKVRDGSRQYASISCKHHGGCPVCEGNRTFASKRREPLDETHPNYIDKPPILNLSEWDWYNENYTASNKYIKRYLNQPSYTLLVQNIQNKISGIDSYKQYMGNFKTKQLLYQEMSKILIEDGHIYTNSNWIIETNYGSGKYTQFKIFL